MVTLALRPYQQECLDKIIDSYSQGVNRQLVHLPTAAGKTVIFANLIQKLHRKTLILAHTIELLTQAKNKLRMICPELDVGLVNASSKEFDCSVVISTIQSARQADNLNQLQAQRFQLLVYDECHHAGAESSRHVLGALGFGNGTKRLLTGFSATPKRSDGRGLGEVFDEVVYHKPIKELIKEGYLCRPRGVKVATNLDLAKVEMHDSDFTPYSLAEVMNTAELNELVVKTYIEEAFGRQTICFGVSVSHAVNLCEMFNASGVASAVIHGKMPQDERNDVLKQFEAGTTMVLCNCQVLTEGFDAPQTSCVIIARPTQSPSLYQQIAGRGLRLWPNKSDCLILDFGDRNHSLCTTTVLTGDTEFIENRDRREKVAAAIFKSLPSRLNQKLKRAVLEFNLLGDEFVWQREGAGYFLKGAGGNSLSIIRLGNDHYSTFFRSNRGGQWLASDVSFDYAFASAEDFARANRSLFTLSDLGASWRQDPISEKQKGVFASCGYRAGIDELSKGQASTIILSGILKRGRQRAV